MQNALLCTGYGAVDPRPRADRAAVEAALQAAAPGWAFARAVTSPVLRARMAQNGLPADSVAQALEKLAAAGCRTVVVQPTNLLPGRDYEALCAEAAAHAGKLEHLRVGEPLLACTADLVAAARAVTAAARRSPAKRCCWPGMAPTGLPVSSTRRCRASLRCRGGGMFWWRRCTAGPRWTTCCPHCTPPATAASI